MALLNIGIVGCGRILNAHLRGYKALREAGLDNFRITALCSRDRDNALRFRKRGEGPPPFVPLGRSEGDPLVNVVTATGDLSGHDVVYDVTTVVPTTAVAPSEVLLPLIVRGFPPP